MEVSKINVSLGNYFYLDGDENKYIYEIVNIDTRNDLYEIKKLLSLKTLIVERKSLVPINITRLLLDKFNWYDSYDLGYDFRYSIEDIHNESESGFRYKYSSFYYNKTKGFVIHSHTDLKFTYLNDLQNFIYFYTKSPLTINLYNVN